MKYQIKEEYAYLLMTDEDVIKAVEKTFGKFRVRIENSGIYIETLK